MGSFDFNPISIYFPDNAYSCDPRVRKFKEAERAEKEARKRAKQEAARREALLRKEVSVCSVFLSGWDWTSCVLVM